MKDRLEKIYEDLFSKLKDVFVSDLAGRTYYGEAYMYSLASMESDNQLAENLLKSHLSKYKKEEDYRWHHEFHWYAFRLLGPGVKKRIANLSSREAGIFTQGVRFKPTNWLLMRILLLLEDSSWLKRLFLSLALRAIILLNQKNNGLVLDRRIGRAIIRDSSEEYRSHQYHLFITVLLFEIASETSWGFVTKARNKAFLYVKNNIITDDVEIIKPLGRGMYQIFGYACLVYLLSLERDIPLLGRVVSLLEKDKKEKNSLSLIVGSVESDKEFWESYNNLYDYLPFTAWMIKRSLKLFQ